MYRYFTATCRSGQSGHFRLLAVCLAQPSLEWAASTSHLHFFGFGMRCNLQQTKQSSCSNTLFFPLFHSSCLFWTLISQRSLTCSLSIRFISSLRLHASTHAHLFHTTTATDTTWSGCANIAAFSSALSSRLLSTRLDSNVSVNRSPVSWQALFGRSQALHPAVLTLASRFAFRGCMVPSFCGLSRRSDVSVETREDEECENADGGGRYQETRIRLLGRT